MMRKQRPKYFVRLPDDGESATGVFCGEPLPHRIFFTNEACLANHPQERPNATPTLRVAINFYLPDLDEMRVLDGNVNWFRNLLYLRRRHDLDSWLFRVERPGSGDSPKATYKTLPQRPLTESEKTSVEQASLNDLTFAHYGLSCAHDWSAPVAEATAQELISLLRPVPRPFLDAFLRQFEIRRVRDLAIIHEPDARLMIAAIRRYLSRTPNYDHRALGPFA